MRADEILVAVQRKVSLADRDIIARAIASETNSQIENPYRGEKNPTALGQLNSVGLVEAPLKISPDICDTIVEYFRRTPCYAGHVPAASDGIPRLPSEIEARSNYGSYTLEQNMLAPHIPELALDDAVLDLAGGYLGCLPSLYSINTFWTFPAKKTGITHLYHRDLDDFRFLAVFIYWTDVTLGEGEFRYIRRSHNHEWMDSVLGRRKGILGRLRFEPRDVEDLYRRYGGYSKNGDRFYRRLFGDEIDCVCGPPGTAVVSDTFNLHKGSLPSTRPRLVTWLRYGLYKNDAYRNDKTTPVDASMVDGRLTFDERKRYICRLVISS